MKRSRRNVYIDEPVPAHETERFVEVPKGNDRMFAIELRNRGRVTRGTATVWHWRWICEAVKSATVTQRYRQSTSGRSRYARARPGPWW